MTFSCSKLAKRAALTAACAAAVLAFAGRPANAKELDQFSYRKFQVERLPDGTAELDAEMNRLLKELEKKLNGRRLRSDEDRVSAVDSIFQHPVAPEVRAPYEIWIVTESKVPLFQITDKGIFRLADYDDMSMTFYVGNSEILRVAEVLVGVDKFSHFFGQGWRYFQELRKHQAAGLSERQSHERVLELSHRMEQSYLGVDTTGVYSHADLAANMKGLRFFRSLFKDWGGGAPYFEETDEGYRLVRRFAWKDYVTKDWDEVLNPSFVRSAILHGKIREVFHRLRPTGREGGSTSICAEYKSNPGLYERSKGSESRTPLEEYVWSGAHVSEPAFPIEARTLCGAAE